DIHTHGAAGYDFLDGTIEAYSMAARMHMRHGTTALMPTITTAGREELTRAIKTYDEAEKLPDMPEFIGLHLEGPYFADAQRGAQDPNNIRNPDPREYISILDMSKSIRRWSVAVELPGALELGFELNRRGIIASVGHTDALYEDMLKAADYGYKLITHFYSGMSGVRRINAYRYAGVIESGYLMDDFDVEIIADGHHLPASLLKLIYKVKGSSHICLVTDSINAAGLPEGTESKIGSVEFIVENGVAKLLDRSAFAGSVTCANRLLKTMVELAGVPICEAVKMLTLTPARISGVDDRMGSLVPGKTANITVFDKDYSVSHVFVRGKLVYGND
ncbi:MAG: amidohydrolase family protein, partial [Clostridiales bacterium]|nr:amidohydrolase family protein [Clostridiales bacterium]